LRSACKYLGGGLCPLVKVWEEIELTGKKNHNSKYFYT
jgi:hypothetical protein